MDPAASPRSENHARRFLRSLADTATLVEDSS